MLLAKTRLYGSGFQLDRFQLLAAVAVTLDDEDGGVVEDSVQSAEQIRIPGEVFRPGVRLPVAGEDHTAGTLFAVTSVDQVKEELGVHLVKYTATDLINNQAGRLHKEVYRCAASVHPSHVQKALVQLGGFQEERFHALLAASPPISHGKMRFSYALRTDEGQIPMRVHSGQGREVRQAVDVLSVQPTEVEVFKGLGVLQRQTACPQQGGDYGFVFQLRHMVEDALNNKKAFFAKVVVMRKLREVRRKGLNVQRFRVLAYRLKMAFRHLRRPPCQS